MIQFKKNQSTSETFWLGSIYERTSKLISETVEYGIYYLVTIVIKQTVNAGGAETVVWRPGALNVACRAHLHTQAMSRSGQGSPGL